MFYEEIAKATKEYEEKIARINAERHLAVQKILDKIFKSAKLSEPLKNIKELKILVPCAGIFPSFDAFVELLNKREYFPRLEKVDFVTVDPSKYSGGSTQTETANGLKVKVSPQVESLDSFLQKSSDKFHIIYFEQPYIQVSSLSHRASLWWKSGSFHLKLREGFPFLAKAIDPNGIIIAACKTPLEISQMKYLLEYSLDAKVSTLSTISRRCDYTSWNPISFSQGAVTTNLFSALPTEKMQQSRAAMIKRSDQALVACAFLAFLLFLPYYLSIYDSKRGFASFLLMLGQVFASDLHVGHKPGIQGVAVKAILCLSQAAILFSDQTSSFCLLDSDKSTPDLRL